MDLSFICFDQTSSRHELFEFIDDERIFPKSFPLNMDERIEIV